MYTLWYILKKYEVYFVVYFKKNFQIIAVS